MTKFQVEFLVDAGYLSWVFGPRPELLQAWSFQKMRYSLRAGALMIMDAPNGFRKSFYPEYKAHRTKRIEDDPEKLARKELVDFFRREILGEDPTLRTLQLEGFEADDWIGIAVYSGLFPKDRQLRVIGVDKDLLQMPQMMLSLERHTGEPVRIFDFASKQALAVECLVRKHYHVLLTLALLGDKSDNIPRVVPPRKFDPLSAIYRSDNPFSRASETYGYDFRRNLYLTLIPCPWSFEKVPSVDDLPQMLDDLVGSGRWLQDSPDFKVDPVYTEMLKASMIEYNSGEMFDNSKSVRIPEYIPKSTAKKGTPAALFEMFRDELIKPEKEEEEW